MHNIYSRAFNTDLIRYGEARFHVLKDLYEMFEGTDLVLNESISSNIPYANPSKRTLYLCKIPTVNHRNFDSVNQP